MNLQRLRLNRFLPDLLIVVAALALTAFYVAAGGGNFPLDDSWIHQTYARNLAQTGVWSFVPGVPSAASTSPLYTVVLTVGYWLGVQFQVWTHGLGALALAGTGLVGRRLAQYAAPTVQGIGLVTGLALVFAWHLLWAAASGMETMIFSLFTLVVIGLAWRESGEPTWPVWARGIRFGVAAALLTLARPEGVLLLGLTGLALLIAWRSNLRQLILWIAGAGVAFMLLLLPYLLFNLQLTGGLLPNTAAAKQAYAQPVLALDYLYRLRLMIVPLLAGGQLLLIPGIIVYAIVITRQLRRSRSAVLQLLLPLWGISLIMLYAAWLPLWFQHGRYVIPALPALIVCGVVGIGWVLKAAQRSLVGRVLIRTLAGATALLFLFFALGLGRSAYQLDVQVIQEEMVAPARWIAANLPPEERLAIHDIGAVGYFAPRPLLDIAGLISPEFVPVVNNAEGQWALIQANGARYMMALPDQVPGEAVSDGRLCPRFQSEGDASLRAGGGKMTVYFLAWEGDCPPENP